MNPAPIALFVYARPEHTRSVIEGLATNPMFGDSDLWVFSDAPKDNRDSEAVESVRSLIKQVRGPRRLEVVEQSENLGLSRSIIDGVSRLCGTYGKCIVLEDDIVPTPYFLEYVNEALELYKDDEQVMSIGCYSFSDGRALPDTFFLRVPDCWGWAVWARSWRFFEEDGQKLLYELDRLDLKQEIDFGGVYPYYRMLEDHANGLNDSWAVRWYAATLLRNGLVLYPGMSVTDNVGFDNTGTHTGSHRGKPPNTLAHRSIPVVDIPVEVSELGTEVWRNVMRNMQPNLVEGLFASMREKLGRLRRHARARTTGSPN